MKKKLVSSMLVSSTIATNIISGSSTIVFAVENIGDDRINEITTSENIPKEEEKNSENVGENIEKPEIIYPGENEGEEESQKVEENEEIEDKKTNENEKVEENTSVEIDESETHNIGEVVKEVNSINTMSDGPAIISEDIFAVKHSIMGQAEVTKGAFKEFFRVMANKNGFTYKLNCTIEEFVDIAYEEASIEGVRADIVIAQAVWETGYFQYGGIVSPDDNNYAGIGAVGTDGVKEKFESPRIGLRAQIQHLKAYASTESLKQTCVDPRFKYVTRGSAPSVEELAGKWAVPGYNTNKYSSLQESSKANDTYGQLIYGVVQQAKTYNGTPDSGDSSSGNNNSGGNSGNTGSDNTDTEKPTLLFKGQVVNVTSSLNVRDSASTSAKVVATLKPNQNINIYGETNGWYKVDYIVNGITKYGYSSKDYIAKKDEVSSPTQPEKPAPPAIIPPENSTSKVGIVSTSSSGLNMRSGAGTNYSVIDTVPKGKEVNITGESGSWYKINYSGKTGYVSKDYIRIKSEGSNTNPPAPSYQKGTVINISSNLNVRTEPSTSSSVIGYLLNGDVVKVVEQTNGWYKIIFNTSVGEKEGYVSGQYLKVQ